MWRRLVLCIPRTSSVARVAANVTLLAKNGIEHATVRRTTSAAKAPLRIPIRKGDRADRGSIQLFYSVTGRKIEFRPRCGGQHSRSYLPPPPLKVAIFRVIRLSEVPEAFLFKLY